MTSSFHLRLETTSTDCSSGDRGIKAFYNSTAKIVLPMNVGNESKSFIPTKSKNPLDMEVYY